MSILLFGAEKIHTILAQRGHQVSTRYVASIMAEMGLSSVRTTAKRDYLNQAAREKKKDMVRQQFLHNILQSRASSSNIKEQNS